MVRSATPRARSSGLRIGGFERMSLVDWPGQLAAVVFCQGCAWNCRYCHNPHLIPFRPPGKFSWENILSWLEHRRGLLDAVVFSGGEPTLHPGLYAAMQEARALEFKIGLHTGGPVPESLFPLLPLLDWVGFDFKAPFPAYARVTGHPHGEQALASYRMLHSVPVPCEVRTTWHPRLLSNADLLDMARSLADAGCTEWIIQRFRPEGCNDQELCAAPIGEVPLEAISVPGLNILVR
ncbi:MAG TPA: anaerobic ribonucleoside-triphosphate reductase activating protein [Candidatus Sulfotelmatobacter sp.]|nr:anaerobic ribonucleoside-triphosphate reductase activating protein [Candidatus Sulfotelmatobacter sp.]